MLYTFLIMHYTAREAYAVAYFFFFPFVVYFNLQTGENIFRIARSVRPLLYVLCGSHIVEELVELRKICVQKTVYCVDTLGWGMKLENLSHDESSEKTNSKNSKDPDSPELSVCF